MSEFTHGICQDGAAILRNNELLTIEEILNLLNERAEMLAAIVEMRGALEWARPYVARIRDTQRINEPLSKTKKWIE